MRLTTSISCFGLLVLGLVGSSLAAAETADIPSTASGTYELVYEGNKTGAFPFNNKDKVTFVFDGTNDTMCVNGASLGKGTVASNGIELLFVSNTNTIYALVMVSGGFHEINVMQGNVANYIGGFTGTRTSTSTACVTPTVTSSEPTLTTQESAALTLAEELFPTLFSNGDAIKSGLGYLYRFYPKTQIYVGFKDSRVYVTGGVFGTAINDKGTITELSTFLAGEKAKQPGVTFPAGTFGTSGPTATTNTANSVSTYVLSSGARNYGWGTGSNLAGANGTPSVEVLYTPTSTSASKVVTPTNLNISLGWLTTGSSYTYIVSTCALPGQATSAIPTCPSTITFDRAAGKITFNAMVITNAVTSEKRSVTGTLTFTPF